MNTSQVVESLSCGFQSVQRIFPDCHAYAARTLSVEALAIYVAGAEQICRMGRGEAPVLAFLEEMPGVATLLGDAAIDTVLTFVQRLTRTPNGRALTPLLQGMGSVARAYESLDLLREYLHLLWHTMQRTSPKVHGLDKMYPSECLVELLTSIPQVVQLLSFSGLSRWVEYGVRAHFADPDRQRDYFLLATPDSRAVLQRERHGTLFVDAERRLDLYLAGLWQSEMRFIPYSLAYDTLRKPVPYFDVQGLHLPEVYDDRAGVRGIDRYRALLAHVSAHKLWTQRIVADNLSPFQRMAAEMFEDARVEYLARRRYPGLRVAWQRLHPHPDPHACPPGHACIRHRLTLLSYALLYPDHGYQDTVLLDFVSRFHARLAQTESTTAEMAELGVAWVAKTRVVDDFSPKVWFDDTVIDYRDDNRLMWQFIEEGDEEGQDEKPKPTSHVDETGQRLPPRLYAEWDYVSEQYRPDWVSVYEHLHPAADAGKIDHILDKHRLLSRQLKRLIDQLKPQNKVRQRYQEEGTDLDLDVAIRALTDYRSGAIPDPRVNFSHRHDGRNIAVSLLLDLSASLNDVPAGSAQSKLMLSQEAISLLGWAIAALGDKYAISGFHSNTRHDVRFWHIKGYSETWGDPVKARLAAMEAGYSTRMGAAMRHAAHYLAHQQAERRILLLLTDGEPADIDSSDARMLIEDTRMAVRELAAEGIAVWCVSLDPHAGDYVHDIFGKYHTIIDHVARLPEQMTRLFMTLTR